MADEAMQQPPEGGQDLLQPDTEIPVKIDSLEADGTRPSVGDEVTVKITGTVKSIENDCVYVLPEQVNDTDLDEILAEEGSQNEDSMMQRLTSQADQMGTPMGGGGGY
jgi:hypothetical protein